MMDLQRAEREVIRQEQRRADLPYTRPNAAVIAAAQATIASDTANRKANIKARTDFNDKNVRLAQGDWIAKKDYDKLTPAQQAEINRLGIDKYNEAHRQAPMPIAVTGTGNYVTLANGENVSAEAYAKLTPSQQIGRAHV